MSESKQMGVVIPAGLARLQGILSVPQKPSGVVVFAHGSGSGRFSPRNQFVARFLQEGGIATLLVDLLTDEEAADREKVFDIPLLADRLLANARWLRQQPETKNLSLGYFGASTGAGAALQAAARAHDKVVAIVSRGGRPDLVSRYLRRVKAPTLLIVGGEDKVVISLNEKAYGYLRCPKELVVVPGATHLFEEPGTLEKVAQLARDWFSKYFLSQGGRVFFGAPARENELRFLRPRFPFWLF